MGNIIKNGEMFGTDSQTIASLETIGSAATQAYAVGSYLVGVLNGEQKVYEVTAAIAKGNTITVGTNVKATDVATLITALNSNYANLTRIYTKTIQSGVILIRMGHTVMFVVESGTYTANGSETMFQIPKGYRPVSTVTLDTSFGSVFHRFRFYSNGKVDSVLNLNNYPIRITAVWITENDYPD